MWAASWLGIAILHNLDGDFPLFGLQSTCFTVLPSSSKAPAWPHLWGGSLVCENFSAMTPSPGQGSLSQNPLSHFFLNLFPHLILSGLICLSGHLGSSWQCPDVLWELFLMQMILWYICGGEGGLPIYSSAILKVPIFLFFFFEYINHSYFKAFLQ